VSVPITPSPFKRSKTVGLLIP